jgi:chlorobactene glucosyltransferase
MLQSFFDFISPFYFPVLVTVTVYFFILSLANHYEMWRFTSASRIFDGPMVSVLVPARNEERNIERCINSLRNQFYRKYEILALDDNSTDNTLEILNRIAALDRKVRVINGKPLPDDWYGKPYAMHQLANEAKGKILIFTDADTIHTPTSIAWAVTNMRDLGADMLSGYVGQVFLTLGEIITVPLMFFLTGFAIPLFLNRYTKLPWFSAAIGQFIVVRKAVFFFLFGCKSFMKKTSEDIYMSRYIKSKGYNTRFLNITEHIKCRMYNGYHSAVEGIGKNIFDFLGKNTFMIFLIMLLIIFFLVLPFPLMFICIASSNHWTWHVISAVGLQTLTWLFMFLGQRLNWSYGFLWPLMYLNLIYMGLWSWFRTISGRGFLWKGRKVS